MIRGVPKQVWAFDLEWVPDCASGRRAYDLPPKTPDGEVYKVMWTQGGGTEQEPRPYLKTMLCRVVSVAAVVRKAREDGGVSLHLTSLPEDGPMDEAELIGRFLGRLGETNPRAQIVGFNSREADVPILIQRGIAQGVQAAGFCRRPEKPWDGYDYFHKNSDAHVDLREIVGGWGKATPKLHEFACACGIPGKIDASGENVIDLWLAGDVRRIVEYNEFDALTTYLLWLRLAYFAGHFTGEQYEAEQARLCELIARHINDGRAHLARYMAKWEELRACN
jgi:predicted PolB exonuclease-like 3'-5' exonuclease